MAIIVETIRDGNYQTVAVAKAGIGQSTFHRWMERGTLDGDEHADYREFRASVEAAEADAEILHIQRIAAASKAGSWTASAWWLERRFPERWSRKDTLQHEGADAFAAFLDEVAKRRAEQVAACTASGSGDAP